MNSRELVVLGAVVLVILIGGLLFLGLVWGIGGMGFGTMGPGMMAPRVTGGIGVLGWLICLAPIGLVTLVALGAGAVWLLRQDDAGLRQMSTSVPPHETPIANCPSCDRRVEPDWQVCPHCGTLLGEDAAS